MSHIGRAPRGQDAGLPQNPSASAGVHISGLPGTLPPGEAVLWQAAPAWRSLARHLCHIREVAIYFAILLAGIGAASLVNGGSLLDTAETLAPFAGAACLALALLLGLAWLIARTTQYTLTTHRLVMRFGIALHATMAIPNHAIANAAIALHKDGTGDLPLATKPGYPVRLRRIWPHARPWHLRQPQPMLRCVPDAATLAPLLARTLATAKPPHNPA